MTNSALLFNVRMCLVAGKRQSACSQPVVLSLCNILHEVPLLLDMLPSKSLAALLAVSQTDS